MLFLPSAANYPPLKFKKEIKKVHRLRGCCPFYFFTPAQRCNFSHWSLADSICDPFSHTHPIFCAGSWKKSARRARRWWPSVVTGCEGKFFSATSHPTWLLNRWWDYWFYWLQHDQRPNRTQWSRVECAKRLNGGEVRTFVGADDNNRKGPLTVCSCDRFSIHCALMIECNFLLIIILLDCPFSVRNWLKYIWYALLAAVSLEWTNLLAKWTG